MEGAEWRVENGEWRTENVGPRERERESRLP